MFAYKRSMIEHVRHATRTIEETTSQLELTGLINASLDMRRTARGDGGIYGDSRVLLPEGAILVFFDSLWTDGRTLQTGHKQPCIIL